jgi:hypothetical protein
MSERALELLNQAREKLRGKRLVNCKLLKSCKLWEGSHEHQSFQYGGLKVSQVLEKIKRLYACDDRTPDENEYLEALKATLMLDIS